MVRYSGKGFPSFQSYEKGDQLIEVNVWSPQHLTHEEKDMLERLKNSPNFAPGPDARAEREERGFFDKIKDVFSS